MALASHIDGACRRAMPVVLPTVLYNVCGNKTRVELVYRVEHDDKVDVSCTRHD